MKRKRFSAILLCVVMLLCALVPVAQAETVTDRADSWSLGDGWTDTPSFRFNNYGKDTLTFTNPTSADETDGNWSMSADVMMDMVEMAKTDQRMLMTVNLANGDRYIVWFQRRWVNNTMLNYQTRLQTNLNGANGDVKFKTSGSSAEAVASASGNPANWLSGLPTIKTMQAETSFRLSLSYQDGKLTMAFDTIDGTRVFTLTGSSLDSTADNYVAARPSRITSVVFTPDSNAASTNFWTISNLTVNGAAGANAATAEAKNYAVGNGWESLNGFELAYTNTANDKKATWAGSIPENTEFSLQYDMTHQELTYSDLTDTTDRGLNAMTQFSVGGDTFLLRVARRYNSKVWKNYFTIEVMNKGSRSWTKILDQWVNTPEYTGYRVLIERDEEGYLSFNIFSLSGKSLVTFYDSDEKSGAHKGAVTGFCLHGQNGYGKWKYNNLSLTVGDPAVPDTQFGDAVMWKLASGWTMRDGSMRINASRGNSANAACRLLTNAQGTFALSYQLDFLTSGLDTAGCMSFRLAGKTFAVTVERVKIDNAWKNRVTVQVDGTETFTQTTDAASSSVSVTLTHDKPQNGNNLRLTLAFADGTNLEWGTTEAALGLAADAFDGQLSAVTFTGAANNGIYAISKFLLNATRDTSSDFRLVGVQNTAIDATADNRKIDIRLVGVLDSLEYNAIGMDVLGYVGSIGETPDRTFNVEAHTVYGSILPSEDGAARKITAAELGGKYIWTMTVCGVPASGTVILVVTPYTVKDGNKTTIGTYEVTYTDGAFVSATKR